VAALSTLVLAGPADAARGGANSSSLELVVLDSGARVTETSVAAAHGDSVTFDVQTSADRPFVGLRCWQGEAFVYDAYVGYFPGYSNPEPWFTLDSAYWQPGEDATCTARLLQWSRQGRENVLATISFAVSG
jgi:hypothetical protein